MGRCGKHDRALRNHGHGTWECQDSRLSLHRDSAKPDVRRIDHHGAWASDNPDALQRFVRAHLRGQAYIDQHKKDAAGVKLIASYTKVDADVVAKIKMPEFLQKVDLRAVEETARLMVRYNLLKKVPDLQSVIYSPSVARAA
jgi:hypothetical protein